MRTYKRKTTRCYTTEDLKNAAKAVNDEGKSVNAAVKEFGIKRMTLTRFLKNLNEHGDSSMGYATPRQVFSPTQEDSLKKYLLQMASIFYGYSPKDVCRLAYECAVKFGIKIPPSWTANKIAGKEWLTMFLKRNPGLSIRKPEPEHGPRNKENKTIDLIQVFFPDIVRPYPKAGPRKAAETNRRKRKAAILTDTPERNALEEQQNKTTKKVRKPKKNIDKKRKKGVCKKILQSSEESDNDDNSCLICCAESLPEENWIQCQACSTGLTLVCVNCNSDNDD